MKISPDNGSEIVELLRTELSRISGIPNVTLKSRLWHDIGLRGKDAQELIGFINSAFDVDIKEFVFEKYFPPEGWSFREIMGVLRCMPMSSKKCLTVLDLLHAIQSKNLK